MAKIIDPDSLAQTTDVVFATAAKTIEIKTTGTVYLFFYKRRVEN